MSTHESFSPEDNLGLVHLCANRFRGRGIEYEELYSAGCMGLVKASKAFDPDRGVKFSTYAVPVILGEIKRLFRDGGTIKVSRGLRELSMKLGRMREKFIFDNGREPTVSELAELSGEDPETVAEAVSSSYPPLSLTAYADDSEGDQLDIPVPPPDTEITDKLALSQAIKALSDEDRELITLRYFRGLTQVQSAKILGMTQVQVSRREKRLLASLRSFLAL